METRVNVFCFNTFRRAASRALRRTEPHQLILRRGEAAAQDLRFRRAEVRFGDKVRHTALTKIREHERRHVFQLPARRALADDNELLSPAARVLCLDSKCSFGKMTESFGAIFTTALP